MKITGTYTIDAPQDQVWAALNDIEVLARIVPGCERLEQTGENEFRGTVKIGIQSIRGTYDGRIRLEDIQPPHHYRLVAHGKSANGVVDGSGAVDLAEQDGQTLLTYAGDAQIGGTLASVGQRLIEGAARQMINQSLKALVEQINARAATASGGAGAESAEPAATPPSAQAEETSQSAPTGAGDRSMPWPFPGSTHPAMTSEPPSLTASAQAPAQVPPSQPPEQARPAFTPRTVVVPDHEQLKPETIMRGIVNDALKERPWLVWVVVAFFLGYILGRLRG